jgi:acyl carrier protein
MNIPPKLKQYLDEARGPLPAITDPDQPLQIDSLAIMRLVDFIESDLGIRVEDEDLLAENFATLRALDALIASKSQVGGKI